MSFSGKHLQLVTFKGQGEDARKRLGYYKCYTTFMDLNDERPALALLFFLKGVARTLYDSLQQGTQKNVCLLKQAFLSRFKSSDSIDISVLNITQN